MGMRFPALAKQSSTTPGTGAYELLSPATGFVSFVEALGNGGRALFVARDGAGRELFEGVVTAGTPDTLARTKMISSTNGGAAVNWAAGTRDIYCIGLPGVMGLVVLDDNATLQAGDLGALHRLDAATAKAATLPSLADLFEGWAVPVENVGAGTWTLTPDGADEIDGEADHELAAGESCWLIHAGAEWTIAWRQSAPPAPALPRSYLAGLGLSNNGSDAANDVDIAAGECRDGGNAANMVLAAALTKRLDAGWAVGTNQGGIDTGSKANSTWYYVWLIRRSDTGVVDALFSTSATTPVMPTNYDQKRRLGAVRTDDSGNLLAFTQRGDDFRWTAPTLDVTWVSSTTRNLGQLKVPAFICLALFDYSLSQSAVGLLRVNDPVEADTAPSATAAPLMTVGEASIGLRWGGQRQLRTDASGRVAMKASGAIGTLYIETTGWIDRRGRDE